MSNASLGVNTSTGKTSISLARAYDNRTRLISENDTAYSELTSPATQSSGSISVSGSEQTRTYPAGTATATIGINGSEQSTVVDECSPQYGGCPTTIYDGGGDTIYVNGVSVGGFGWGSGATSSSLASSLASAINGNSSSPVTAVASGSNVILTSKVTGTSGNYGISVSQSWSNSNFSYPSFTVSAPSSMSGGTNSRTVYDSGNVSVTINSTNASVSWGNDSSSSSIASQLQSAIASCCGSFLTASVSGSTVSLKSNSTGSSTNWPIQLSVTHDTTDFSSSSFSASPSGMSGGANAGYQQETAYQFSIPSGAYTPNGNLSQYTDSVMGTWSNIQYDTLNRITSAGVTSGPYNSLQMSWAYDAFGN